MIATLLAAATSGLILCADPRIIDGDTFRCDGSLKIRLWGINAPERTDPGGLASAKALAALTRGQTLVCRARGQTLVCRARGNSYDRTVAQCWIGGQDVAGAMVAQGQAVDLPKFSRGYYAGPR